MLKLTQLRIVTLGVSLLDCVVILFCFLSLVPVTQINPFIHPKPMCTAHISLREITLVTYKHICAKATSHNENIAIYFDLCIYPKI